MSQLDVTDPHALRHHFWGSPVQPKWAELLSLLTGEGLLEEQSQKDTLTKRLEAVRDVATISLAGPGDLSFATKETFARAALTRGVSALIVSPAIAAQLNDSCGSVLIATKAPKIVCAMITSAMYPAACEGFALDDFHGVLQNGPYIAPTATVSQAAVLEQNVRIGPGAVIGAGAVLGAGCVVGPNAVIGAGVLLGHSCQIGPGAVVLATVAGHGCQIRANAVIGERGFGVDIYRKAVGESHSPIVYNIPQISGVRLGNRVEVRHQAIIDRGALTDTILGDDARIDSHSTVGHGTRIGNRVSVGTHSAIGGQAIIEDDCILWARVGVEQCRHLGPAIQVKYGSGVTKNFPQGNMILKGYPAMNHRIWNKQQSQINRYFLSKDNQNK